MSAKGVAVIAQHVIKEYPEILDITKKTEANFDGVNKLKTFNYMLKGQPSYRKEVDGLQTGTTDLAGASFVAHSNESGMSIITDIINAEHTDTDDYAWFTATNELLNYVVYHWESKTIAKKGQAISKIQVDVLDGKSKQVSAVAKSDFNIIQKIDANNNKHIKVTTNQIQSPVKSGDKVGTATFEDRTLVGDGYLPNQGMPSMELVAGKEVKKSFFLKVWWNHFHLPTTVDKEPLYLDSYQHKKTDYGYNLSLMFNIYTTVKVNLSFEQPILRVCPLTTWPPSNNSDNLSST